MIIHGYYYLNTRGDLLWRPYADHVEAELNQSSEVKHYWPMDMTNDEDKFGLIIEACSFDVGHFRIDELRKVWEFDKDAVLAYAEKHGITVAKADALFIVTAGHTHAYGTSVFGALVELCKRLKLVPSMPSKDSFATRVNMVLNMVET